MPFASAVPRSSGVAIVVRPSPRMPVSDAASIATVPGFSGSSVSIVSASCSGAAPSAATLTRCAPSLSGVAIVKLQAPVEASATTVPSCRPSSVIATVAPASTTPTSVGEASEVMPSPSVPVSDVAASAGGDSAVAFLSIVSASAGDALPMLPAASRAIATTWCTPTDSGTTGVYSHRPALSAISVAASFPSIRTVTLAPASATPVSVGV